MGQQYALNSAHVVVPTYAQCLHHEVPVTHKLSPPPQMPDATARNAAARAPKAAAQRPKTFAVRQKQQCITLGRPNAKRAQQLFTPGKTNAQLCVVALCQHVSKTSKVYIET